MSTRMRLSITVFVSVVLVAVVFGCNKPAAESDGSSAAAASAAGSDLKWWAITEISPNGNLICTLYAFGPGDFVYRGAPRADAHTADDLRRLDPANVGTVTTEGSAKTFHFPGQPAETPSGGVLQEVIPFAAGTTFEGSYSVSNSSNFGGVEAVGGNVWTFHANGTFEHETFGGVATTPQLPAPAPPPPTPPAAPRRSSAGSTPSPPAPSRSPPTPAAAKRHTPYGTSATTCRRGTSSSTG
jgi:hypothetical protein